MAIFCLGIAWWIGSCLYSPGPAPIPSGANAAAPAPASLKDASGHVWKGTKLYTLTGEYFGEIVDLEVKDSQGQNCVIVATQGNPRFFLRRQAISDGKWRIKE